MSESPMEPEMIGDVVVETDAERQLRGELAAAQARIADLEREALAWRDRDGTVLCWYCGAEQVGEPWHQEHQTPRSRGGTDAATNRVWACPSCNLQKGAMTVEEFRDVFEQRHGTRLFYAERELSVPRPDRPGSWRNVFVDDDLWLYLRFVAGAKGWTLSRTVQDAIMKLLDENCAQRLPRLPRGAGGRTPPPRVGPHRRDSP